MTGKIRVFVDGIGVLGSGLSDWPQARAVLSGHAPVGRESVVLPPVAQLPPAERRRTGAVVRLAAAVGLEALEQAGQAASDMATVFTSSGGDSETIHAILEVLATDRREVSPTRFHNSVHNAPSGYWALAVTARAPSTSLCAFDGSFATGLLDAAAQSAVDGRPVMLVAYDLPYPEPLHAVRPIGGVFGVALVLTPQRGPVSLAALDICLVDADCAGSVMADAGLEQLRRSNPAARSLPLLASLAGTLAATVRIEGIEGSLLDVVVTPC